MNWQGLLTIYGIIQGVSSMINLFNVSLSIVTATVILLSVKALDLLWIQLMSWGML